MALHTTSADIRPIAFEFPEGTAHNMEQQTQPTPKLPIPRLSVTTTVRRSRIKKSPTTKRAEKRMRDRNRVNLGPAFQRWRDLRVRSGFRTDADLATFFMDRFEKTEWTVHPTAPSKHVRDDASTVAEIEEVLDDTFQPLDSSDEDISGGSDEEMDTSSSDVEWLPGANVSATFGRKTTKKSESNHQEPDCNSEKVSGGEESQHQNSLDKADRASPCEQTGKAPNSQTLSETPPAVGKEDDLSSSSSDHPAGLQNDEDRSPPDEPSSSSLHATDVTLILDPPAAAGPEGSPLDQPPEQDCISETDPESDEKQISADEPSEPLLQKVQHKPRAKTHDCLTCGKVFPDSAHLRRHLVIHTGNRPYKCFICGRGFTQSGNLKTHMKVHKGEVPNWALILDKPAPAVAHVRAHVCSDCGMDFPDLQQLTEHRDTHKKPYSCPDCGKAFKNETFFIQHRLMHTGGPSYPCSRCGKAWATVELLKIHELSHSTEKNYHCKQCGKAFVRKFGLKKHLRSHTGERPYLCSICGRSYFAADGLKMHLRVHSGERPYTCSTCGKGFYYSHALNQHIPTHEKKPKRPTKPLGRPKKLPLMNT